MDLTLTPAQAAFRDEVRSFIAARLPDQVESPVRTTGVA